MNLNEVAPPTKKHERMVKHIKKNYKKDGKLTDDEKSIAYATAWKNYNKKESFEIDKSAHKAASKKAKMRNLAKGNTNPNEKAAAEKKAGGPKLYGEDSEMPFVDKKDRGAIRKRAKNLFKRDIKGEHHGVNEELSRRSKPSAVKKRKQLDAVMNKYDDLKKKIGSKEKHMEPVVKEATYQEMIDAGWEMTGEGIWWPPQETETVTEKISFPTFKKKVAERKPEKAQDAGAKARRAMKRREHAKYVSGSEDNVPDDMRD